MAKVICLANQKGGVGKSTCTANIAHQFSTLGHRTLVIDCDPQGNLTYGFGFNPHECTKTLYHLFTDDQEYLNITIKDLIVPTKHANLDIIASNTGLEWANRNDSRGGISQIFKTALDSIANDYDFIFLDTPPSLGRLTEAALASSDFVLIPVQCEYYAMVGMAMLLQAIALIKKRINPNLQILGTFANMYAKGQNVSKDIVSQIQDMFGQKAMKTVIPRSVRVTEAQHRGIPLEIYEKNSPIADAFHDLAQEVLANAG